MSDQKKRKPGRAFVYSKNKQRLELSLSKFASKVELPPFFDSTLTRVNLGNVCVLVAD